MDDVVEKNSYAKSSSLALILVVAALWPLACGGKAVEDEGDDGAGGGDGGVSSGGTFATGGTTAGSGGSSPQLVECDQHSDCVVDEAHCCTCDPVSSGDLQAVRAEWVDPGPECNCEQCPEVSELDRTRQYFIAECHSGQCELVDIRDEYASCMSSGSCILREGGNCCEGCDGQGYIAVGSLDFLGGDTCENVACDPCTSPVPEGIAARCHYETGMCQVVPE